MLVDGVTEGTEMAAKQPPWLARTLAERTDELIAFRRDVHRHPELARRELRTTASITRVLTAAGIAYRVLPGGSGVIAEVGSGDRIVGLRGDIDALPLQEESGADFASEVPGVSHACGHDVHTTCLLGAALALSAAPALPGRVRLVFQPAEEVMPGGAHEVIDAGGMAGVERIFALHCDPRLQVGRIGLRLGPITSTADMVDLTVTGRGGHTARPHLTADLVYALGMVITELPGLLSRRLDPRSVPVMVWGAVHAGQAANAIPQTGRLTGTLRMMDRAGWDQAEPLVRELVGQILAPTGVGYDLSYVRGVPPVDNDQVSYQLLTEAARATVGIEHVVVAEQSTGAEDFAVLLEEAPGGLARLGVWDGISPQVDLHSGQFRADEEAMGVGVTLLVNAALAALTG